MSHMYSRQYEETLEDDQAEQRNRERAAIDHSIMLLEQARDTCGGAVDVSKAVFFTSKLWAVLVEVGRKEGDGLPKKATGAALMVYATGVDEDEAVRETVAILKQADMATLDVTGYGTAEEGEAQGHEIGPEERALMDQALAENAVIVAEVTPFFD